MNSAKSKAASIDRTVKNIDIYRQNIDREVKIIKTDLDTLGRFVKEYKAFILYAENQDKSCSKIIKNSGYNYRVRTGISDTKLVAGLKITGGVLIIGGTIILAVTVGSPILVGAAIGACIGGGIGAYKGDVDSFLKYSAIGAVTGFAFGGGSEAIIGKAASSVLSKTITSNFTREILIKTGTGLLDDALISYAEGGMNKVKNNFLGSLEGNVLSLGMIGVGKLGKVTKTLGTVEKVDPIDYKEVASVGTKGGSNPEKQILNGWEWDNYFKKTFGKEKVDWVTQNKASFSSRDLLESHFTKHGNEFGGVYNTADEYLQGAKDVMNNGYKVQYDYKVYDKWGNKIPEKRTGYLRFMGSNSKGKAKFEFVGTNSRGDITTYHAKSGKGLWKLLTGYNTNQTINPVK